MTSLNLNHLLKWVSVVAQLVVKKLPAMQETDCNARDAGSITGWEDPLEKEMATTPVILFGKSHGQRNLVGCRPRGP